MLCFYSENVYDIAYRVVNDDDDGKDINKILRLDDAFCIQYNMSQDDTTCAKHMDPSDITVNICLEKTMDCVGSQVVFYGRQDLKNIDSECNCNDEELADENFSFMVDQMEGYATIHWGHHPHMTLPLRNGRRTNIVLTYCFQDVTKSGVISRTCYLAS